MTKYKSNCKIASLLAVFALILSFAVGWINFGKIKNLVFTKTSIIQIQKVDQPEQVPINYITSAEFETGVNSLVPDTYPEASLLVVKQEELKIYPVSTDIIGPAPVVINKTVDNLLKPKVPTKVAKALGLYGPLNNFKLVNGKKVCDLGGKNHPSVSSKGKGRHIDEDCCIDYDEMPNGYCSYDGGNKADAKAMPVAVDNMTKKIGSKFKVKH